LFHRGDRLDDPLPRKQNTVTIADKYGPWALVVGGSEGVGAHLCEQLASDGVNLVIMARKPEALAAIADRCRAAGVEVRTVSADVSLPEAALESARRETDDLEIGLLVYMAGANLGRGVFPDLPLEQIRKVVAMNVDGQILFTHHYSGLMKERGRGGIVLIGSIASYAGVPLVSQYSAAKAFSRIFSEAIWYELAPFGVDVVHVSLDFTATPAMERLGYDLSTAADPKEIAAECLAHIGDGPVWNAGGPANVTEANRRLAFLPRDEAVRSVSLPPLK
jgi:uncharacterized protein